MFADMEAVPALDDTRLYFNRELSWLEFNRRVLEEAQDAEVPLLERLKFLAIFSSNLDEFFMVRVGGIQQKVQAGIPFGSGADRMPPRGRNINYFEDARVTELAYAADRTVDQTERKRLLVQAQQRIAELLPELPLYSITKLDAVPAALHGFTGNPTNTGVFWNVHEWEFR